MSEYRDQGVYTSAEDGFRSYLTKVFTRMGIALGVTALTAFAVYVNIASGGFMYGVLQSGVGSIILLVAQLGICIALSAGLTKFSTATCTTLFYGYAVLTGITFSILPMYYGISTVFMAFVFASVLFFSCAVIGHTTNVDLTKFSGLFMGGLIALVVATVVSMFIPALRNSLVLSYIGVLLFLGITAWDVQKLKALYYQSGSYGTIQGNLSVFGSFQLYLDFINIFLYVLRILGSRNRN